MLKDGNGIYVPMREKLQNFGLLKISFKKFLDEKSKSKNPNSDAKFFSEMWCETKDMKVGGKIDLIVQYRDWIEIIDFKTGALSLDLNQAFLKILSKNNNRKTNLKNEFHTRIRNRIVSL